MENISNEQVYNVYPCVLSVSGDLGLPVMFD